MQGMDVALADGPGKIGSPAQRGKRSRLAGLTRQAVVAPLSEPAREIGKGRIRLLGAGARQGRGTFDQAAKV